MALLTDKHPQKDFFILDIQDIAPKDDTASMEHPFFSLATKPDMRELLYQNGDNTLRIVPSSYGLPTIFDKDILIFCISQLMHRKNQGKPIGKSVRFSAREMLIATNRTTDGQSYKRLEASFIRLGGCRFVTNIRTGNKIETRIFGMINDGGFVRTGDKRFRLDYCEVVLSDWVMNSIETSEVLSIHRDYFRIRRPLERRIYELARKHCGLQESWKISLNKLQLKTGSKSPIKRFRYNIKEIANNNHLPAYTLKMTPQDMVIFYPKIDEIYPVQNTIIIPEWAESEARVIAIQKGWDYYAVEQEWKHFINSKHQRPKSLGHSFVGFFRKKEVLR